MAHSQPPRRSGRPSKYDWDDKRDICYKLYVEEQKSVVKIIKYFTEHFGVDASDLPCPKGFFLQFGIWGFPSHRRKLDPDNESRYLSRIKELWEHNVSRKDIKQTLLDENDGLASHEFNVIWRKNGLRRRQATAYQFADSSDKRKRSTIDDQPSVDISAAQVQPPPDQLWQSTQQPQAQSFELSATIREQRLYELQLESEQKRQTGKRRRRIRGYAHLPPDAPGSAPRYASETSLDECKAYLHLSNEMYLAIRADYEAICRELDIIKKTLCAEGIWEESKNRLVRDNLHLNAMMHPLQPDQEKKAIALDCICADVTKRMRAAGRQITIAEASNTLNLNPVESKAVRRSLYEIFDSNNFESRLLCGEDLWNIYRLQWLGTSGNLQQAAAENDPRKTKCIEVLCSDVMKRIRDDKVKRGERVVTRNNRSYGPGPGPAPGRPMNPNKDLISSSLLSSSTTKAAAPVQGLKNDIPSKPSSNVATVLPAQLTFNLDPTLQAEVLPRPSVNQSIPAYFSLAPGSRIVGNHPRMWLGKLHSATIASLHQAATSKFGAAKVAKVHGLIKKDDGGEDSWLIENEDELEVYLLEAGEKAKFMVLLEGGYA